VRCGHWAANLKERGSPTGGILTYRKVAGEGLYGEYHTWMRTVLASRRRATLFTFTGTINILKCVVRSVVGLVELLAKRGHRSRPSRHFPDKAPITLDIFQASVEWVRPQTRLN